MHLMCLNLIQASGDIFNTLIKNHFFLLKIFKEKNNYKNQLRILKTYIYGRFYSTVVHKRVYYGIKNAL